MNLYPRISEFHFGLEKPVKILHLTDAHLALTYASEGEEVNARSAHRRDVFFREAEFPQRDPVGYLEDAMEYSKQFDCTVITGDVLDLVFERSKDEARRILAGKDYMFCAGNHEFCKHGVPETFATRKQLAEEVQPIFRGNMFFESRIVGGVNIITVDNSYLLFTEEQLDLLKAEVARGLPILLFCHCPLNDRWKNPDYYASSSFQRGATDEMIEIGCRVVRYIEEEPLIKAIFAGHYHFNATEHLGNKTTYILGGLFKGIVGEILID